MFLPALFMETVHIMIERTWNFQPLLTRAEVNLSVLCVYVCSRCFTFPYINFYHTSAFRAQYSFTDSVCVIWLGLEITTKMLLQDRWKSVTLCAFFRHNICNRRTRTESVKRSSKGNPVSEGLKYTVVEKLAFSTEITAFLGNDMILVHGYYGSLMMMMMVMMIIIIKNPRVYWD